MVKGKKHEEALVQSDADMEKLQERVSEFCESIGVSRLVFFGIREMEGDMEEVVAFGDKDPDFLKEVVKVINDVSALQKHA